ncbi:ATPase [Chromatiales bacterium (ex Bugula neritina AB1)]|nr:ATPase [Chromatiales bacterium (ex Bugula neritina AB1)]
MQEIENLQHRLSEAGYIADSDLATAVHLTQVLQRPLLLEGDAGVGKTAVAQAMAKSFNCELIRLQCYEGLDVNTALYEWNYQRQLMTVRLHEKESTSHREIEAEIFSKDYLLPRPLLQAITTSTPALLLIDEIDRADDEFEAFLLELLSDFQITIPELGTIEASHKPTVILTSNATRDLSDALRRRCLYHFVDYPGKHKELKILNTQLPELDKHLASSIVNFVQKLRREHLKKIPGVAETLDWAAALIHLDTTDLDNAIPQIEATLSCLLKTRADREMATTEWLKNLASSEAS